MQLAAAAARVARCDVRIVPRACTHPWLGIAVLVRAAWPLGDKTVVVGVLVLWNLPRGRVLPWPLLHAISGAQIDSADVEPLPIADV